ncbi:hypothetical protein N0X72_22070 [Streptomyces carpaticus]|uniref:Uncharacterized protein n=1 Tax=Streptomyces harbinensis TaxID=1176198 RepID=A0A1I6W3E0_9ACTN|nr:MULTISPECIES: hypothetical protein [Streptomyces]UWM51475.1 hypothetical protein N0X72_22070 [Streptomyces carpaticus]SFT20507.1 hypothetical protein SAMN05444716_11257 [Streptomyces harbinensis]
MNVRSTSGLQSYVSRVGHGSVITLLVIQGALEDIGGGVRAGQWRMVAAQTRQLVLAGLQVSGLERGGEPYWLENGGAFDPVTCAPEQLRTEGYELLREANGLAADPSAAGPWLTRLETWTRAVQDGHGPGERLPELRSPQGMFGGLRLVRGWTDTVDRLGLPPLLPGEWTQPV